MSLRLCGLINLHRREVPRSTCTQKLARKHKACTEPFGYAQESPSRSGSKSINKYRQVVAALYERVSNSRQDFLHKLSHKLVSDSQAVIVENLHVKGMVRNS